MGYNSVASLTIQVYLHSFSCYCLRNTRIVMKFQENLTLQQFKVIQGHRSWCHPSSTIRIFLITNHQPLLHICITLPVESAPFFMPSTSFCSLSFWFTSSCTYHLITVTTFALRLSLPLPSTPDLKLISFTNPFLHSHSYSFRTDFTYLTCTEL